MSTQVILFLTIILIGCELFYFRIAARFNIIDTPNHRSSHSKLTIRGGGIIFPIAVMLYAMFFGINYPYFIIGTLMISIISFLDDVKPISNKVRMGVHLLSTGLLFIQVGFFSLPAYLFLLALIVVVGLINAINFMDGINGITGSYSFVVIISLLIVNIFIVTNFSDSRLMIVLLAAILIFSFFNFRNKAICFAGDVGSISIAYVMMFLTSQLILNSLNPFYILFFFVYGIDAVTTIVFRIIRGENVFDAHRSHFYQYLSNERGLPQLLVSSIYALSQLFVNTILVLWCKDFPTFTVCLFITISFIFVVIRFSMEGRGALLGK